MPYDEKNKSEEAQAILDSLKQDSPPLYYFQTPEYGFGSAGGSDIKEKGSTPKKPSKTETNTE